MQEVATIEKPRRRIRPMTPFWGHAIVAPPPPLENGDRLTRDEFERRYHAMPHIKKAELIEGVVHMPTPVSNRHSEAHGRIMVWLGTYCAATPGVHLNDNATVRLDMDNEPQPDALLRLDEALGGRSRIGEDDYIEGAPELIAEVAASSVSYDLHDKLNAYRRNGVREYVVWRIYDEAIDWFHLQGSRYVPLEADDQSIIRSRVFPGLWLHTEAMLRGDLAQVLATVQQGLATKEHEAFIEHTIKQEGN